MHDIEAFFPLEPSKCSRRGTSEESYMACWLCKLDYSMLKLCFIPPLPPLENEMGAVLVEMTHPRPRAVTVAATRPQFRHIKAGFTLRRGAKPQQMLLIRQLTTSVANLFAGWLHRRSVLLASSLRPRNETKKLPLCRKNEPSTET